MRYRKTEVNALVLGLVLILAIVSVMADTEAIVEPVLKPDPAILDKLAALGDNSSCILEGTKVMAEGLGDFAKGSHNMAKTGPSGRGYSAKMAWMSDRKRAFFCGASRQVPHCLNDAWEYDLAANTWVLLYVPDYNDVEAYGESAIAKAAEYDKQTLVLKDGWLRTKNGGPAEPSHTWWGLTYDPGIKAAIWHCRRGTTIRHKEKLAAIGAKEEDLYTGPPMWAFYPYKKKWEPLPSAQPWPPKNWYFANSLEYIPELKGSVLQHQRQSWLFDADKKAWKELPAKSGWLPLESVVCWDPGRKMLIGHSGDPNPHKKEDAGKYVTVHNPLKDGVLSAWDVGVYGGPPEMPLGHDAHTIMYFDVVGKVALLYERQTNAIWAYNPDEKKWTKLTPQGPTVAFNYVGGGEETVGYYDPERNVFVVIGHGRAWCYRYKKAEKK